MSPALGVVGLGYVGLPLCVAFAESGREVVGVDVDAERVAALRAGRSYVEDIADERWREASLRVTPTTDPAALREAEEIVLCVPTPLTPTREPDLGPLLRAARDVGAVLSPGQLVVLESTTYPGTTRERLAPVLEERSGLRAGIDFHVAYSPERIDPGRTDHTLRTTPKIVAGLTADCRERALALFEEVSERLVAVSSLEAAELAKLLENVFRAVNIAMVNELAILCDRMSIDVREVIDAASTKPYGFMRFEPGPGMGGHCLPVDPFYLSWRARSFGVAAHFIELAGEVNRQMPVYCVERAERALNALGKPVRGSRIAIVGVAYKGGVGDLRESPALPIMAELDARGADLAYHDPHVPALDGTGLASAPLEEAAGGADLAIVVTAHPETDHAALPGLAELVLDLRGVLRDHPAGNVVAL